jgi:hypothetical protein
VTVVAKEHSAATSDESWIRSAVHEKPLRESVEDASVLLWYATREGKPVSKETVEHIVAAQAVLSTKTRDPEVEGQFWIAFRDLATAIRPVSVDSILATYSYPFGDHGRPERRRGWRAWWFGRGGRRRLVDAATTKKKYSICSIIVLCCLLLVQIYWYIGTTFRTDLETHRAELDRIAGSLREMAPAVKAAQAMADMKGQQLELYRQRRTAEARAASTPPSAALDGETNLEQLAGELDAIKGEESRLILAYANVTRRGSRVILMLKGNSAMLAWWDVFTDFAGLSGGAGGDPEPPVDMKPIPATASPNNGDKIIYYADFSQDTDREGDLQAKIVSIENALVNDQLGVEISLLNSKSTLDILSQYVLPLLYGLLGSLAYILRTLSREIHNVTFTRGSEIRYSLRWPLGMLGGVTVGLFFDPSDLTGFAVITPLGLAFLAGYGVELLFTGLDRMVSAFTGEGAERPRAA